MVEAQSLTTGQEGFIPFNFVAKANSLEPNREWGRVVGMVGRRSRDLGAEEVLGVVAVNAWGNGEDRTRGPMKTSLLP